MTTIVDVFKYEQSLRESGIPPEQATMLTQALTNALHDPSAATRPVSSDPITKADLKAAFAEATTKMMWVIGAQFVLLAWAIVFIVVK